MQFSTDELDADAKRAKLRCRQQREETRVEIAQKWAQVLNPQHIRHCIVAAKARDRTCCVLYTEEKNDWLHERDYDRLLHRVQIQDGKTVAQLVLENLEPSQFRVYGTMIGYTGTGFSFRETAYQIRLGWSFTDRHCVVQ